MSSADRPTVVLAGAGTHPEIPQLARALAEREDAITFISSSMWHPESWQYRLISRLPVLGKQAQSRQLASVIPRRSVCTPGFLLDCLFFLASRRGPSGLGDVVLSFRNRRFERVAARQVAHLERGDIVIGQQTAAGRLFQACPPGVVRVLVYPIAHHRWMKDLYAVERLENPDWADFLQGDELTDSDLDALDREIELADLILVGSSFVRETFLPYVPDGTRIRVCGLSASNLDLASSRRNRTGPPFEYLFAGQVNQRKGISYFLDALAAAEIRSDRVTFVGPVHPSMKLRLLARGFRRVLGSVSREEMARHYEAADVVVLPSLAEGFGLTAIEAMARGCVVVVSENTFAHDVIESGRDGFIVRPRSADALAEVLQYLESGVCDAQKISVLAAARAADFSWDRFARIAIAEMDACSARCQ